MGLLDFLKRPKQPGIRVTGGPGLSMADAIAIHGAPNGMAGIAVEYQILEKLFGRRDIDWSLELQLHDERDGRRYDVLSVALPDGSTRRVYFDITDFYGRGTNDLLKRIAPDPVEKTGGAAAAAPAEFSGAGATVDEIATEVSNRPFLHGTSQLCAPVTGCVALRAAPDANRLCTWGYFNPFGPTCESLSAVESSGGTWLLYRQSLNPFAQLDVVYGAPLAIDGSDGRDPVHLAVGELFATNGGPDVPLLNSLPSYVLSGEEEPLNATLRDHFFAAAQRLDDLDLTDECAAIERHWCRPWDLAGEQRDRAMPSLTRPRMAPPVRPATSPVTRQLFDRWWSLVHGSDHAVACLEQMKEAWQGAIAFQAGSGASLAVMPWHEAQTCQPHIGPSRARPPHSGCN